MGNAWAQSTINPALPANGQPYSPSIIRAWFDNAYKDINALYTAGAQLRGVIVTPQQYGAIGNGITDDATSINTALTALSVLGGGKLTAVNGSNYAIGSTITIPDN